MLREQGRRWLAKDVFPLWSSVGLDHRTGFVESLDLNAQPRTAEPRRAMVIARQMYAFRTGLKMGVVSEVTATAAIATAAKALVQKYSMASGGFYHTVDADGRVVKATPELYTQAFALFGLAQAFALSKDQGIKARAVRLLDYLERERRHAAGGFTELGPKGEALFQSNPHMHLYEAALAWMEVDGDPRWSRLADRVLNLCRDRFIDKGTGLLAEHFDENWIPLREKGRFYFEPGHQYEWSWLMGRHAKLSGRSDLTGLRRNLFEQSERHGVDQVRKAAWDQVWSDFEPKLRSSRFWPQTERIKAAAQLQREGLIDRDRGERVVNEGLSTLFRYLKTTVPGLWYDTWEIDGRMTLPSVKASSLYHIIGAISEAADH